MKRLLTILFLICSLTLSAQTKWYVATTGSDSHGKGTLADPWLTVKHAADTVTGVNFDNDTIILGAGLFIETAAINSSVKINYKGAGQSLTTVRSTYAAAYGTGLINMKSALGDAIDGSQSISDITFDGDLTGTRAIQVNFRSNVRILNCTFIDFLYSGVTFVGTNQTGANWQITPTNVLPVDCEVSNSIFTNCTQRTGHAAPGHIRIEGSDRFSILNNVFDQTDRAVGENHDIICIYQNKGIKINDNTFYKNDSEGGAWNFFAEQHYTLGGCEILRNKFYGAACWDLSGVVKGTYSFGANVMYNTFESNGVPLYDSENQPFLDLESFDYSNDIAVSYNKFTRPRRAISVSNFDNSANDILISYNLIDQVGNSTNTSASGISVASRFGTNPKPINGLRILNNVISASIQSAGGIYISAWGDITDPEIRNNIITGDFYYPIVFALGTGMTPTVTNLNINKNIFFGNDNDAISYGAGITFTNRDDTGNLTNNPLFVNPVDFHLQVGSLAIDAGYKTEIIADYDGYVVPFNGITDIGAYEFGSHKGGGEVVTVLGTGTGNNMMVDKNGRIIIIQ